MLGQLSGEEQADSCLDLSGRDGLLLVVEAEARCLAGDPLENIVHERVHDGHSFGADAGIGVHLLQHLVYVDGVGLLPLLPFLLAIAGRASRLLSGLLFGFLSSNWRHFKFFIEIKLHKGVALN